MLSVDGRLLLSAGCVAVAAKLVQLILRQDALLKRMPPGPKGLPIVGNLFQLSMEDQHLRFTELGKEYGPIVSLYLAGQPVIVVNSIEVASDLFYRPTEVHSDRPHLIMVNDIMTEGLFVALAPYGQLWRKMRRAAHEAFNVRAVEKYQKQQEIEASILVNNLLKNSHNWMAHTERSAASTILSVVYGWPPLDPTSDGLVKRINGFMHRILAASLPGAYLVEIFPILRHLPAFIAPWKQKGQRFHREDTELFESFLSGVKDKIATDSSHISFAASLLNDQERFGLNDKEVAWLAGTMFAVGADTTGASIENAILAMSLYPEVARRAQAELDAVVGRERMPTVADRPNLPYIEATVKEVLRWRTTAGISVRRTMKDDWCKQYLIPEGSILVLNNWAMNQDPEVYSDPDVFRPERFLDEEDPRMAKVLQDTRGMGHFSFGGGRRSCIGMNVASQALFINIARLLWATNIEALPKDDSVVEGLPHHSDEANTALVRPKFFRCSFKPRFDGVATFLKPEGVSSK